MADLKINYEDLDSLSSSAVATTLKTMTKIVTGDIDGTTIDDRIQAGRTIDSLRDTIIKVNALNRAEGRMERFEKKTSKIADQIQKLVKDEDENED